MHVNKRPVISGAKQGADDSSDKRAIASSQTPLQVYN